MVNALAVRPVSPVAFTYLVGAGAALVAAYGVNVPQTAVGAINAAVLAVLALLLRGQVTPTPAAPEAVSGLRAMYSQKQRPAPGVRPDY